MPNYNLIMTPTFKAKTYDELMQPVKEYDAFYRAQENELSDLSQKADAIEAMANEQSDPVAYNQYKQYAKDLRDRVNSLVSQGLTPNTRADLLNMKRRFSSEIVPITTAFDEKTKQVKEQRDTMLKDPTALFSYNASTTSLDDYLNNPLMSYKNHSGANLEAQSRKMAEDLKNQLREIRNDKRGLHEFVWDYVKKFGMAPATVHKSIDNFINGTPEKGNIFLQQIARQVMEGSGIKKWNNPIEENKANWHISRGLWGAVGRDEMNPYNIPDPDAAGRKGRKGDDDENEAIVSFDIRSLWGTNELDPDSDDYIGTKLKELPKKIIKLRSTKGVSYKNIKHIMTNKDLSGEQAFYDNNTKKFLTEKELENKVNNSLLDFYKSIEYEDEITAETAKWIKHVKDGKELAEVEKNIRKNYRNQTSLDYKTVLDNLKEARKQYINLHKAIGVTLDGRTFDDIQKEISKLNEDAINYSPNKVDVLYIKNKDAKYLAEEMTTDPMFSTLDPRHLPLYEWKMTTENGETNFTWDETKPLEKEKLFTESDEGKKIPVTNLSFFAPLSEKVPGYFINVIDEEGKHKPYFMPLSKLQNSNLAVSYKEHIPNLAERNRLMAEIEKLARDNAKDKNGNYSYEKYKELLNNSINYNNLYRAKEYNIGSYVKAVNNALFGKYASPNFRTYTTTANSNN